MILDTQKLTMEIFLFSPLLCQPSDALCGWDLFSTYMYVWTKVWF